MSSQVSIRNRGRDLFIRVQAPLKAWERLFVAAVGGAVLSGLIFQIFKTQWWPLVAIVSSLAIYFAEPGMSTAELRMSAVECYSSANVGKNLSRGRVLLTADILWLEYNEHGFSMSDSVTSGGVYAVKRSGSVCLLPLLNGDQTMQVIAAIEQKFPGLAENWRKQSPWGNSIQTLPLP